nr:hypothetical protein [Tanacetum cinerariifolium]
MDQNVDFSGDDQIQNPQYPLFQENPLTNDEFEAYTKANDANMNDLQFKLDNFQKNQQDFQEKFEQKQDDFQNQMRNFIQNLHDGPPVQEPPQNFDICQLIRKECCVEDREEQEVKNVVEQSAKRGSHSIQTLKNFKVVHKSSISSNTSQISSIHSISPNLSTKEPENLLSMRYEHLSITPETESDEVTESNADNLLQILSKYEVALEDKKECDLPTSEHSPVCNNHSDTFSDSKIDDDISVYNDDFEDIEYVEASLPDPDIVSIEEENGVEEENVVQQEEEEVDFEDISQVQDVVLREKLFSINCLIANIKSLNDNPTPVCVFNSSTSTPIFEESDNSLLDNFSPEFDTFCDHSEETRSGNTTHADNSLPEYDSFCFEIEPDQERLIYLMKNDISDSSNDPLLEEVDLFLSDDSIPPGIENVADDPEGDI